MRNVILQNPVQNFIIASNKGNGIMYNLLYFMHVCVLYYIYRYILSTYLNESQSSMTDLVW